VYKATIPNHVKNLQPDNCLPKQLMSKDINSLSSVISRSKNEKRQITGILSIK